VSQTTKTKTSSFNSYRYCSVIAKSVDRLPAHMPEGAHTTRQLHINCAVVRQFHAKDLASAVSLRQRYAPATGELDAT